MRLQLTSLLGLILWLTGLTLLSDDPESTQNSQVKPHYEVTKTEIKLPGVTIKRATREVFINAQVCLDAGILEYLVCGTGTFEHESIFSTTAKPEFVHAALLLCGMKPTPQIPELSELWAEKVKNKKNSRVKIEVEWQDEKVIKRVNVTKMVIDRQDIENEHPKTLSTKQKSIVADAWVFAGSFLHQDPTTKEQIYTANLTGNVVGIFPEPSAVIQYGISCGNPYEADHLGLKINTKQVPKLGTPVKIIFSLHDKPVDFTKK